MSVPLIKDCGDIWNRLFDHRPFLNGEIKLHLKEFEETRGDREVTRLFEIYECVTDFRDSQIDKACSHLNNLSKLNTLLDISLQNCEIVNENQANYDPFKFLEDKRITRKREWDTFMADINEQYSQINSTFKSKEEELQEFYKDLEHKLCTH